MNKEKKCLSEVKWPEKINYFHSKKEYPYNCVEAANKMHDAFMKVINALPSKGMVEKCLCPRDEICDCGYDHSLEKQHLPKERPVDANKTIKEGSSADKNELADVIKDSASKALGVMHADFNDTDSWPKNIKWFYLEFYKAMMEAKLSAKPTIPSVEEIELVLDKNMSYCPDLNKIAQEIHQMLSKEKK